MSSVPNFKAESIDFFRKKGRLEQLTGVVGALHLKRASKAQNELTESENNAAAQAMGWKPPHNMESEDDMGDQIVLGDMVQHLPQAAKPSILPALLAGAAIAGIPGAGAVGYLLNQQEPAPVIVPGDQSDVNIGLMRIEELEE